MLYIWYREAKYMDIILSKAHKIAGKLGNKNIAVCKLCCCVYSTVLYAVCINGEFLYHDHRNHKKGLKCYIKYCPQCGNWV